jgi:hypothetical protein
MEPEGSLPHSQVPATCPYPEPDQSSPCDSTLHMKKYQRYKCGNVLCWRKHMTSVFPKQGIYKHANVLVLGTTACLASFSFSVP